MRTIVLFALIAGTALGADGDRFLSRAALLRGTDTERRVVFLGPGESEITSAPAANLQVLSGGAGVYLRGGASGFERAVRVEWFDEFGNSRGAFPLPIGRSLRVGTTTLLSAPAAPHQLGAAFDLEFLAQDGAPIAAFAAERERLITAVALPDGGFAASSLLENGGGRARAFDSGGRLLWQTRIDQHARPAVALSRAGDRGLVCDPTADVRRSRILVLDGTGARIARTESALVLTARFSPDGRFAALIGPGGVALLEADSGRIAAASPGAKRLLAGTCVWFDPSGARLALFTRDEAADSTRCHLFEGLPERLDESVRDLGTLTADPEIAVLDVRFGADGSLDVATTHGRFTVTP